MKKWLVTITYTKADGEIRVACIPLLARDQQEADEYGKDALQAQVGHIIIRNIISFFNGIETLTGL